MNVSEIMNNLGANGTECNMQLNLNKLSTLDSENRKMIINFFNNLMDSINGTSGGFLAPGGFKYDPSRIQILYNTLTENEYLITRRESNLNKILE
jgi:hypothetical protein